MAKKTNKAAVQTVEETKETVETTAETQKIVDDLKSGDIVSEETNPEGIKIEESEPVNEKIESVKDEDSKEPVVTETLDTTTETEVPQDTTTPDTSDKPVETETPDAGDTEPADKTPTDPVTEPVTEEKPTVALSSVYPVRYHVTFSQKRMAFVREMPVYNMLSTWCFNKSSFFGCTSKKDYEEIESCVKSLPENKVRVEGIMLSEAAKEQFLLKLKANTDYCVLKWGDKRK